MGPWSIAETGYASASLAVSQFQNKPSKIRPLFAPRSRQWSESWAGKSGLTAPSMEGFAEPY